jgi:glutathione synthase/RimK-type ligase-like ATP-grasp enzyme
MKVAIHHRKKGFSLGWIDYCKKNSIDFKIVNCYSSNIIKDLSDCDALMWHYHNSSPKDVLFAKQLLCSLETAGKRVYPDYRTNWHFNDKLGQKYLLEAIDAPLVPSYTFYSKADALSWVKSAKFPKVFKLRGGSSSENVRLIKSKKSAIRIINRAFGNGFSQYDAWRSMKERIRRYRSGSAKFAEVMAGICRFLVPIPYSSIVGRDRGYVYFQDFIPNNTHDIRVTYIFNKCFASRRVVRPGDFRASGSGVSDMDMSKIPSKAIEIAFKVSNRLGLQTAAFDFVISNGDVLIVEVSYCFAHPPDQFEYGFWDESIKYHPGPINPFGWMVEGLLDSSS